MSEAPNATGAASVALPPDLDIQIFRTGLREGCHGQSC